MLTYANKTDYESTKAHASKTRFQEGEGHFIIPIVADTATTLVDGSNYLI